MEKECFPFHNKQRLYRFCLSIVYFFTLILIVCIVILFPFFALYMCRFVYLFVPPIRFFFHFYLYKNIAQSSYDCMRSSTTWFWIFFWYICASFYLYNQKKENNSWNFVLNSASNLKRLIITSKKFNGAIFIEKTYLQDDKIINNIIKNLKPHFENLFTYSMKQISIYILRIVHIILQI